MKNSNLHKAKNEKNDEFYTMLSDIEKELQHYKEHFKDKVVYCNCDDHRFSNFYRYFSLNFEFLGLKKLISTHFSGDGIAYKLEITRDVNGDGQINELDTVETALKQNGDFRSDECIELLKEADIVVSNPPFSLARPYLEQLVKYNKYFLFIGNKNAITYKEFFKQIKEDNLWLGYNSPEGFIQPDGEDVKQMKGLCYWFTNIPHKKRNEEIILYKTYNETEYPKYDNYNAINVDKTKEIPMDFDGVMGVPISFLDRYNPNQFELVKFRKGDDEKDLSVNGKCPYFRILIKRK